MGKKNADELFDEHQTADDLFGAEGEAGAPGPDPYRGGPNARQQPPGERTLPTGGPIDSAISWADTAALGGGPQIAGAIGALAHSAVDPMGLNGSDVDAYEFVRDQAKKRIDQAAETKFGAAAKPLGIVSTPGIPAPVKGASVPARAWQAAKVGGTVGAINAAFTSKADLTKADIDNLKRFLLDTGSGAAGGALVGGGVGYALGKAQPALRSTAEEQALKAAGLRGGISNQMQKKLGIDDMAEARKLGRAFLDEGLIPLGGSKESVQKRAESLQGQAGNVIGGVLNEADVSGSKFDYPALGDAARAPILDPTKTTAVARAQGGKAMGLADLLEAQGKDTPRSFVGANRAKSDAWESANFDTDAPVAAKLYRQSVGGARDEIERQVKAALGAEKAGDLAEANRRWGVAADALKLAKNAGTRDMANSSLGLREQLMIAAGLGSGAGAAAGRAGEGLATGIGAALAANWGRKHGNAALARGADFLANRAAENTGGGIGGRAGASMARSPLAPWSRFLEPDEEEPRMHTAQTP